MATMTRRISTPICYAGVWEAVLAGALRAEMMEGIRDGWLGSRLSEGGVGNAS